MPLLLRTLRAVVVCLAAAVTLTAEPVLFAILGSLRVFIPVAAQSVQPGANSDPTYQQLRNLTLGAEAVSVNNLELKREAGTFHLHSGTVCFVTPVEGKVTGAGFVGEGNFILDPPQSEKTMLKLFTKGNEFREKFDRLVPRF